MAEMSWLYSMPGEGWMHKDSHLPQESQLIFAKSKELPGSFYHHQHPLTKFLIGGLLAVCAHHELWNFSECHCGKT